MNRKKNLVLQLSILLLVSMPTISQADSCSDIKERYWKCARSSMTGEKCDASDNISIPPECLKAGSEPQKADTSSKSSTSSFFSTKKKSTPFVYHAEPVTRKPVKIINIKPSNGKTYIETEEDVNQFTTKIKDDLLNAIKEGKKVRLQFQ